MKAITVVEGKRLGRVLPYDPHDDAGWVILTGGGVEKDFHGHPLVYENRGEAEARISELRGQN